jgi:hypothetical protein
MMTTRAGIALEKKEAQVMMKMMKGREETEKEASG